MKKNGCDVRLLLDVYDAYLRDDDQKRVCEALNISGKTLKKYFDKHPELAEARALAKERRASQRSMGDYILGRLSPEARKIWKEMQFWERNESAYEKIEKILTGQTKELKQEIFLQALISTGYSVSDACVKSCVSRNTLEHWKNSDAAFRQLFEEVQMHKEDFYEKSLVSLVEMGVPSAVIFVNKTVNAKRGYREQVEIEHTGTTNVNFDFNQLNLPLEVKVAVLKAIRENKQQHLLPEAKNGHAIDVEPA